MDLMEIGPDNESFITSNEPIQLPSSLVKSPEHTLNNLDTTNISLVNATEASTILPESIMNSSLLPSVNISDNVTMEIDNNNWSNDIIGVFNEGTNISGSAISENIVTANIENNDLLEQTQVADAPKSVNIANNDSTINEKNNELQCKVIRIINYNSIPYNDSFFTKCLEPDANSNEVKKMYARRDRSTQVQYAYVIFKRNGIAQKVVENKKTFYNKNMMFDLVHPNIHCPVAYSMKNLEKQFNGGRKRNHDCHVLHDQNKRFKSASYTPTSLSYSPTLPSYSPNSPLCPPSSLHSH